LADITNPSFYENLKNWLKDATFHNAHLKNDHPFILFPLGFDDVVFYRDFAKLIGFDVDSYATNPLIHTESILYFGNRSRLSVRQCDVKMIDFLKSATGHVCDGICSLKQFPDIIRNGMHHPELCVFDKSHILYVQDVPRPVIGGAITEKSSSLSSLLPPEPPKLSSVSMDNEITNNFCKRFDENMKILKNANWHVDVKIIKHYPFGKGSDSNNKMILKKISKTRKQNRRL
jgi:hypothetical protein